MSSDAQGFADGGASLRPMAPSEAAAGPHAAAVSTQAPAPAASSNAEFGSSGERE